MRDYLKRITEEPLSDKSLKYEESEECLQHLKVEDVYNESERLMQEINSCREIIAMQNEYIRKSEKISKEKVNEMLNTFCALAKTQEEIIRISEEDIRADMKDQATSPIKFDIPKTAPKKIIKGINPYASVKPKVNTNNSKSKENIFNPGQIQKRYNTRKTDKIKNK